MSRNGVQRALMLQALAPRALVDVPADEVVAAERSNGTPLEERLEVESDRGFV
jgi:hypothetical protein